MSGCLKMLLAAVVTVIAIDMIASHSGGAAARWFAGGMMCAGSLFLIERVLNELRERDAA